MKTYAYNVTATYDDCEIEVKTNSADVAICASMQLPTTKSRGLPKSGA